MTLLLSRPQDDQQAGSTSGGPFPPHARPGPARAASVKAASRASTARLGLDGASKRGRLRRARRERPLSRWGWTQHGTAAARGRNRWPVWGIARLGDARACRFGCPLWEGWPASMPREGVASGNRAEGHTLACAPPGQVWYTPRARSTPPRHRQLRFHMFGSCFVFAHPRRAKKEAGRSGPTRQRTHAQARMNGSSPCAAPASATTAGPRYRS